MRNHTIYRMIAGSLAGICLLFSCGCRELQPAPVQQSEAVKVGALLNGGVQQVASNGDMRLSVDAANGEFFVENTRTGMIWYSNPSEADREADPIAKGNGRALLASGLRIEYQDSLGNISTSASYTASSKKDGLSIYQIQNGFRLSYTFVNEKITIPLDVQLTEEGLHCSVPVSEIKEESENRLLKIGFLPSFGAAGEMEDGYFLVPDGSGALISFNNGQYLYDSYSMAVYGEDISQKRDAEGYFDDAVLLPVFGIKKQNGGVLGIISGGAAVATIQATVGGKNTSYNTVNPVFTLRDTEDYTIGTSVGRTKEVRLFQEAASEIANFAVDYLFLDEEQSDYVGMATACREWMLDNGWLKDQRVNELPLYVRLLAGALKEKSVMGIPTKKIEALTTFEQAQAILQQLKEKNVSDVVVHMEGWSEQFLKGKIDITATPAKELGGVKALQSLQSYCADNALGLYLDSEFQKAAKWSGGYNSFQHAARTVSGVPATVMRFDIASRASIDDSKENLLSPAIFTDVFSRFINSLKKTAGNADISIGSAANTIFGDHSAKYTREQTVLTIQSILQQATAEGRGVVGYQANAYMWNYVDSVLALPVSSNSFNIENSSVPFLQIVLKGYLPYSTPTVNQTGDTRSVFLSALENGSGLLFTWIAEESLVTRGTVYEMYSSVSADEWMETAVSYQKELSSVAQKTGDSTIVGHTREGAVSKTTYSNGVVVYVNHGDVSVVFDGQTIAPYDYLVVS